MTALESLSTTGRIADLMLAFLALEILLIGILRRSGRSGIAPLAIQSAAPISPPLATKGKWRDL